MKLMAGRHEGEAAIEENETMAAWHQAK